MAEDRIDPNTGEVVNAAPRHVPAEIIKARIAVMKKAHGVGKSGRNDFHKYDYASDYDVLSLVQPAMVENGLALEMWPDRIEGPDQDGNMAVRFLMQWQHESGAVSEPVPWYGVAQDRSSKGAMGDKWFNKAATAAEKYFLLKQFHIPAGKDVDPDSQSPHEYAPARNGQQQPAKTYSASAKRSDKQPAKQNASPSQEFVERFLHEFVPACETLDELAQLWSNNKQHIKALSDEQRKRVEAAKDRRKAELSQAPIEDTENMEAAE